MGLALSLWLTPPFTYLQYGFKSMTIIVSSLSAFAVMDKNNLLLLSLPGGAGGKGEMRSWSN